MIRFLIGINENHYCRQYIGSPTIIGFKILESIYNNIIHMIRFLIGINENHYCRQYIGSPTIIGFKIWDYSYKSVTTKIPQDAGMIPIPYTDIESIFRVFSLQYNNALIILFQILTLKPPAEDLNNPATQKIR